MGIKNRERRKAKQKAARERYRGQAHRDRIGSEAPDAIDSAVRSALKAKASGDAAGLAEEVTWLADTRSAGIVLLAILMDAVTQAWRCGWQPADLARATRRECDARAELMVADVVAAELREYAAITIDESWDRQLTQLEAVVWWSSDEHYFDEWSRRHRTDRGTAIGAAIDLLHVLARLPRLQVLCPAPGAARRGSLTGHRLDTRLLDRVRALLAKAESTNYPEEAEAYTGKAQELMARHSIDYAMLSARGGVDESPGGRRIGIDNPYEEPKAILLDITARANRSRAIWTRGMGFSTIVGFPSDMDATELLFTSLLVQATAALRHAGTPQDGRTKSFRRSFLTGYAYRIADRLTEAKESVAQSASREHGKELVLVLSARESAVNAAIDRLFPEMTGRATSVSHQMGWLAGQRAADQAWLGHDRAAVAH